MALEAGARLGQYEIVSSLGAGGMGEVYRARDMKLGREVAIKVLPEGFSDEPARMARFDREAKVLASLNHNNIATLHGFETEGETQFLVMELVEGETLAERIKRGAIPVDEALPLFLQIAEGLEAAHENGVIHRDLKPANIKVNDDGQVKILDFGLAKVLGPETAEIDLTHSPTLTADMTQRGVLLGTAAYMSPEQARGKAIDKRTDIWAFGCVLYEMLTGRRAFQGEDVSLTLAEVLKSDPDWSYLPAATSESVRRLLRRCTEKELQRRLRDIGEARILVKDLLSGSTGVEESRRRQGGRRPWGWIATSAGSLLILAGVLVLGRSAPLIPKRVLRYSIPLAQEELTFRHALSPDGRYVAVMAVAGGATQVFVRALDSWELRPLPSTERVTELFWSPDSRQIAFFADNKLKKVAVSGGPATELCDVPGLLVAPGTWGRDDIIVFATSSRSDPGPLRSVPATGGESSPLTTAEPGESHRFPLFLPGGSHFLYTSVGGSSPGIYLASLDDTAGRRLLADESSAHFAPASEAGGTRYLLFLRDGKLMAQPFGADRLELAGEPYVLLEHAPAWDDGAAAIEISENGTLVYLGGGSRETDSRFSWFDRSGNVISSEGSVGPPAPVALSPNEEVMAVPRRLPGRQWESDLFLWELTRGVETRFTFQNTVDFVGNALWSADSSRILFSANPVGVVDLFSKDIRSSGPPEVFLETENPKYVTDWSRDGRYVLYTELKGTQADLWYLTLEGEGTGSEIRPGEPVSFLQTEFLESAGQLSPDGKWIAYMSDESGVLEVYVRPFPTGGGKWKISSGHSIQPRWRSDGRELFYLSGPALKRTLMSVAVTTVSVDSSGELPTFDTGTPEPLFAVQANAFHPAFGTFFYSPSAAGQRFLVNHIEMREDPVLNVVVNWQRAFGLAQER